MRLLLGVAGQQEAKKASGPLGWGLGGWGGDLRRRCQGCLWLSP